MLLLSYLLFIMLIIHHTMVHSGTPRNQPKQIYKNGFHTPVISLPSITIVSGHRIYDIYVIVRSLSVYHCTDYLWTKLSM